MRCNKTKGYNNQQIQVKMTKKIKFTKMHGAGNDYIYVDTTNYPIAAPEKKAIEWSKFHTGIGSDGLILIGNSDKADFSMRIFNADGSEAMMCGNGSRCVGKYHLVTFVDDITQINLPEIGPELENHHLFPDRTNVEFAQIVCKDTIRMRVWERGSGITQACGTGACATAVAAFINELTGRKSDIIMDGGTVTIEWDEASGHILMTGPATKVFDGEIEEIEG